MEKEIINRATFKLSKEHYNSSIGSLEPLTLEVYLAKVPCFHKNEEAVKHVYASYYNLINSKELPSEVLIEDSIIEQHDIADSRFREMYGKLAQKIEKKQKFLKIQSLEKCSLYF